ncbi:MAG: hypothetical protein JJ866_15595 [Roseibium sp.]|uniref:hypothetical protein n=1 Tax=Roseibium sp. TaxID=1936156 RepID=UPI001B041E32|nr:hypothetical protein [Roseibium sp.]MBO6893368.1 hypothetical protein [Roseibium sp.]MBO6932924.1 hypothetical protein [Roseibium sp.]
MIEIQPHPDETPVAFIERADALELADEVIDDLLLRHFGIQDESKRKLLRLKSAVFWERFFVSHASQVCERGGSRYAALRFIQKKNGQCGQHPLSEKQIELLVDSVGEWKA